MQCSASWQSKIISALPVTNASAHSRLRAWRGITNSATLGFTANSPVISVTGEFFFAIGQAAVTIIDKPFWLPEMLLKQKILEGLDTLCNKLA